VLKSFDGLKKHDIQEACRSLGLSLSVKAKDARERVIRRVATLVMGMPEQERERVLSAMRIKGDTQTEGWVNVIRKGQ
jgi:radical SAM superfamily enzyme